MEHGGLAPSGIASQISHPREVNAIRIRARTGREKGRTVCNTKALYKEIGKGAR
jgi:hypothetical protein